MATFSILLFLGAIMWFGSVRKVQMRKARIAQFLDMGKSSLAKHQILSRGPDFVEIGASNGSSNMRCRLSLYRGHLSLVGDPDHMVWAYYQGQGIEGAVAWMARGDIEYYVRQKASIGMGNIGVDEFDNEVALTDAEEHLRELERDGAGAIRVKGWEKIVRELKDNGGAMGQHDTYNLIYEIAYDCDSLSGNFGVVVSPRLVWAWMLVCKAHELIEAKPSQATVDSICESEDARILSKMAHEFCDVDGCETVHMPGSVWCLYHYRLLRPFF
jgi:hypothetical protein